MIAPRARPVLLAQPITVFLTQSDTCGRQPDDSAACQIFGPFFKSNFLFQSLPRRPEREALPTFTGLDAFGFSAATHSFTGK